MAALLKALADPNVKGLAWSDDGLGVDIDWELFCEHVVPKYFSRWSGSKRSKIATGMKQLNNYGFQTVHVTEKCTRYSKEGFAKYNNEGSLTFQSKVATGTTVSRVHATTITVTPSSSSPTNILNARKRRRKRKCDWVCIGARVKAPENLEEGIVVAINRSWITVQLDASAKTKNFRVSSLCPVQSQASYMAILKHNASSSLGNTISESNLVLSQTVQCSRVLRTELFNTPIIEDKLVQGNPGEDDENEQAPQLLYIRQHSAEESVRRNQVTYLEEKESNQFAEKIDQISSLGYEQPSVEECNISAAGGVNVNNKKSSIVPVPPKLPWQFSETSATLADFEFATSLLRSPLLSPPVSRPVSPSTLLPGDTFLHRRSSTLTEDSHAPFKKALRCSGISLPKPHRRAVDAVSSSETETCQKEKPRTSMASITRSGLFTDLSYEDFDIAESLLSLSRGNSACNSTVASRASSPFSRGDVEIDSIDTEEASGSRSVINLLLGTQDSKIEQFEPPEEANTKGGGSK